MLRCSARNISCKTAVEMLRSPIRSLPFDEALSSNHSAHPVRNSTGGHWCAFCSGPRQGKDSAYRAIWRSPSPVAPSRASGEPSARPAVPLSRARERGRGTARSTGNGHTMFAMKHYSTRHMRTATCSLRSLEEQEEEKGRGSGGVSSAPRRPCPGRDGPSSGAGREGGTFWYNSVRPGARGAARRGVERSCSR